MPRINLLPIKAAQRAENTKKEILFFLLIFICLGGGLYFWHAQGTDQIDIMVQQISQVSTTVKKLKQDVTRIEEFKKKSAVLEEKAEVIRALLEQKVGPARLLDDLANIVTKEKRVWLTSITESSLGPGFLSFQGGAIEHEDISSFQRSLSLNSLFFTKVQLAGVTTSLQNDVRYLEWEISCLIDFSNKKE